MRSIIIVLITSTGFFIPQPVFICFVVLFILSDIIFLHPQDIFRQSYSTLFLPIVIFANFIIIGIFTNSSPHGFYKSILTFLWIPILSLGPGRVHLGNWTAISLYICLYIAACFYHLFSGDLIGFSTEHIFRGVVGAENEHSIFYVSPIFFYLVAGSSLFPKNIKTCLLAALFFIIFFSMKRSCWLVFILIAPVFLYRKSIYSFIKKFGFIKTAVLMGCFAVCIPNFLGIIAKTSTAQGISTMGRIDVWNNVLHQPISLDASEEGTFQVSILSNPHNEFLRLFIDWGPVGSFSFFALILFLFLKSNSTQGLVAVCGLLFLSMTSQPLLYWNLGWFQILVILKNESTDRSVQISTGRQR